MEESAYLWWAPKDIDQNNVNAYVNVTIAARWMTCVGRCFLKTARVASRSSRSASFDDKNTHSSLAPWSSFTTVWMALPTRPLPPVTKIIFLKRKKQSTISATTPSKLTYSFHDGCQSFTRQWNYSTISHKPTAQVQQQAKQVFTYTQRNILRRLTQPCTH